MPDQPCYHWHPPRWLIGAGSFLSGALLSAAMTVHANLPLAAVLAGLGGGLGALLGATSGGMRHARATDLTETDSTSSGGKNG